MSALRWSTVTLCTLILAACASGPKPAPKTAPAPPDAQSMPESPGKGKKVPGAPTEKKPELALGLDIPEGWMPEQPDPLSQATGTILTLRHLESGTLYDIRVLKAPPTEDPLQALEIMAADLRKKGLSVGAPVALDAHSGEMLVSSINDRIGLAYVRLLPGAPVAVATDGIWTSDFNEQMPEKIRELNRLLEVSVTTEK